MKKLLTFLLILTGFSVYSQGLTPNQVYLHYRGEQPYFCVEKPLAVRCINCLENIHDLERAFTHAQITIELQSIRLEQQDTLVGNLFSQRDFYKGIAENVISINNALETENLLLKGQIALQKKSKIGGIVIGTGAGLIIGAIIISLL